MKRIFLFLLVLAGLWIAIPWSRIGMGNIDGMLGDYKLGLDLHGGVEIDYLVDFSNTPDLTDDRKTQILEDMKTILDGRVRRVGTTEPTLNTAQYGDETHIIVQIPTPSQSDSLSPAERQAKDEAFIAEAKAVIGQVIKIQFKEPRPNEEFEALKKSRPTLTTDISDAFNKKDIPFDAFAAKMADSYENVFSLKIGDIKQALLGQPVTLSNLKTLLGLEKDITVPLNKNTYEGKIENVTWSLISAGLVGNSPTGTAYISLATLDDTAITSDSPLDARIFFVASEPLKFRPAKGNNGAILDEKHLINTVPSIDPTTGQYIVNLVFDEVGQKMFGDITERASQAGFPNNRIAIYLGNSELTAPTVSERIDGNAIITGGAGTDSKTWATTLSKKINEGIVPVGIYEHSEHSIGPNLGKESLQKLIISGIIGIIIIALFLLWRYGSAGIVAGASLVIYVILLLALIRIMGITLTLSGVAGIVLSLGIAIDSNILLLERVRDFLGQGKTMQQSLKLGFHEAWSAVWDSNLTGLLVGLVLWWMGVSLIKGFGQMTVLGIIVSLWVVRYISNPLTIWLRAKIDK